MSMYIANCINTIVHIVKDIFLVLYVCHNERRLYLDCGSNLRNVSIKLCEGSGYTCNVSS